MSIKQVESDMDEEVLMSADGIYCWEGPKSKSTLRGTKLGALVLTNRRLIFLSTGTNDVLSPVVRGRALIGTGVDGSALENEGSLSIELERLRRYEFVKKLVRKYLSITFEDAGGQERSYSFMNQYVLPGGTEWVEHIERCRQRL